MRKLKIITLALLAIFLVIPTGISAEDKISIEVPIKVNGGKELIKVLDGETVLFEQEIEGDGKITFDLPAQPKDYKFLIKGEPGNDPNLIYDESR